jgi:hypothetical protein
VTGTGKVPLHLPILKLIQDPHMVITKIISPDNLESSEPLYIPEVEKRGESPALSGSREFLWGRMKFRLGDVRDALFIWPWKRIFSPLHIIHLQI